MDSKYVDETNFERMSGIIIREVSRKNIKKRNDVMMTYRFSHVYVRLYDEKVERIFQVPSFRLHFYFVKRKKPEGKLFFKTQYQSVRTTMTFILNYSIGLIYTNLN